MGAIIDSGLVEFGEFFAPSRSDLVDGLVAQYRDMRAKIEQVADIVAGDLGNVVHYFLEGNKDRGAYSSLSAENIFQKDGAIASLNSAYWSKAMALTDVYEAMPQARRDEWSKAIHGNTTPEFTEETVRATLADLMNSRQRFFSERVDGIFRALSGEHVTNSPAAFGKRMILAGITSSYYSTERVGYINDLRAVIAKFMGRDEPKWNSSSQIVEQARLRHGEWLSIDGGSLRIRCYLKGTAHLEVHPDMAWRLNSVLAHLYPMAIPPEFRQKPKKKPKEFSMIGRPLPFAVIELLFEMKQAYRLVKSNDWRRDYRKENIKNALQFDTGYSWEKAGKHSRYEAESVLSSIGGVKQPEGWWQFEYEPSEVVREIVFTGCIPDQKSHQFYPTPESVADTAIEMADIGSSDECCEPQAGQGGLADRMPKERTTCIEISALHCAILRAKGHNVIEGDFIAWAETAFREGRRFDRIVCNPPFADGRSKAHVEAALPLLRSGGVLVAVLPASLKGKYEIPGLEVSWSRVFDNEFAGTSVSVAIMKARKP